MNGWLGRQISDANINYLCNTDTILTHSLYHFFSYSLGQAEVGGLPTRPGQPFGMPDRQIRRRFFIVLTTL